MSSDLLFSSLPREGKSKPLKSEYRVQKIFKKNKWVDFADEKLTERILSKSNNRRKACDRRRGDRRAADKKGSATLTERYLEIDIYV